MVESFMSIESRLDFLNTKDGKITIMETVFFGGQPNW